EGQDRERSDRPPARKTEKVRSRFAKLSYKICAVSGLEERWARVIGRALLPPGILDGVVDDSDFGALWQDQCRRPRWGGALLLRVSLWLAWLAPLWMLRRFSTFGGIEEKLRVEVLEALLKSRLYLVRMAALFLKLTATSLLLGDERALKQLSAYDHPLQLRA